MKAAIFFARMGKHHPRAGGQLREATAIRSTGEHKGIAALSDWLVILTGEQSS
jgi:hypothetical protein